MTSGARQRGYTIIEIAIVLTVMMIVIAIVVPAYRHVVRKSREETLR